MSVDVFSCLYICVFTYIYIYTYILQKFLLLLMDNACMYLPQTDFQQFSYYNFFVHSFQ